MEKLFLIILLVGIVKGQGEDCTTPNNLPGQCLVLPSCPTLLNIYKSNPRSQQIIDFVIGAQRSCGVRSINRNPVVCCRESYDPASARPKPTQAPVTQAPTTPTPTRVEGNCVDPNGVRGNCISIRQCPVILNEFIQRQSDANYRAYIQGSNARCNNIQPNICCPIDQQPATQAPPQQTTAAPVTEAPLTRSPIQSRSHLLSVEEDCGYTNITHTKIVGGEPATLGAWPWMALLGYKNSLDEVSFKCGGSLITNRHILTAAHCLRSNLQVVRLGEHDLTTDEETEHVDVPIVKVEMYPEYDKKDGHGDLAILYLGNDVSFTAKIRPVCLPVANPLRSKNFVGYTPFVAGWGRTQEGGTAASILQELQVPVLENGDCQQKYQAIGKLISEKQFDDAVLCAGYLEGGKDSCQGDSGGPLMAPQYINEKYHFYQIGVVSYGIGCARADIPGVYTKTQKFIDWIQAKIDEPF